MTIISNLLYILLYNKFKDKLFISFCNTFLLIQPCTFATRCLDSYMCFSKIPSVPAPQVQKSRLSTKRLIYLKSAGVLCDQQYSASIQSNLVYLGCLISYKFYTLMKCIFGDQQISIKCLKNCLHMFVWRLKWILKVNNNVQSQCRKSNSQSMHIGVNIAWKPITS